MLKEGTHCEFLISFSALLTSKFLRKNSACDPALNHISLCFSHCIIMGQIVNQTEVSNRMFDTAVKSCVRTPVEDRKYCRFVFFVSSL